MQDRGGTVSQARVSNLPICSSVLRQNKSVAKPSLVASGIVTELILRVPFRSRCAEIGRALLIHFREESHPVEGTVHQPTLAFLPSVVACSRRW